MNEALMPYFDRPELPVVGAMSYRFASENSIISQEVQTLLGQQQNPTNPKLITAMAEANVPRYFDMIDGKTDEDFNVFSGAAAAIDTVSDDAILANMNTHLESGDALSGDMIEPFITLTRKFSKSLATRLPEAFPFIGEQAAQDVVSVYEAATTRAESIGIGPEVVFEADTLYAEIMRQVYTPDQYIESMTRGAETFNTAALSQFMESVLLDVSVMALEIEALTNNEALTDADRAAVQEDIAAFFEESEFKTLVDTTANGFGQALGQVAISRLQNWWGPEAASTLSPATIGRLHSL